MWIPLAEAAISCFIGLSCLDGSVGSVGSFREVFVYDFEFHDDDEQHTADQREGGGCGYFHIFSF